MPHSANHKAQLALASQNPHAAQLLSQIAALEDEITAARQHTCVWDDQTKQLKKQKLQLRDALAATLYKK